MIRRIARISAVAAVIAVLCIVVAGPAEAHAVLVRSSPTDGVRLTSAPANVRLTFDESIELIPGAERVISTTGARADTGSDRLVQGGTTILLTLRRQLPRGSYTATWRVVSADTHIVSGSITFGVGVNPSAPAAAPTRHTSQLDIAADIAQGLVYAGIVLLVGVLAACRVLWVWALDSRRIRVLAGTGWVFLVVGTAGALFLQGPRAADVGWSGVFHATDLVQTVHDRYGQELLGRLAVLVLALPIVLRAFRLLRAWTGLVLSAAVGVALLVGVAITGHEGVGPDAWLATCSAVLHMAAMGVWLGGLLVLIVAVLPAARRHEVTTGELRRWSRIAYGAVACLVVTGEYQASRQVAPVQALWSTRYGVVLLIKIGLVGLIVAAAFVAQRNVLSNPIESATRIVRRSVRIEAALAAAVLAVTAVLVSEPPANTTYGPAVTLAAPLGPDHVHIRVGSTRRGPTRIDVTIENAAGRPTPVQGVTATLSAADFASLAVRMTPAGRNRSGWRSEAAVVPLPGVWTLTLTVALDATESYVTATHYRVW